MKNIMKNTIKRNRLLVFLCVVLMGVLAGCGQTETKEGNKRTEQNKVEIPVESYAADKSAVSSVYFQTEYAQLLSGIRNILYLDAQDGSYMQTITVMEKAVDMNWEEVLINSDIANTQDFQLALETNLIDWKRAEFEQATLEYLTAEVEDIYTIGIMYVEDAEYALAFSGTFSEEVLLETAQMIKLDKEGFSMEITGKAPQLTFTDGGKTIQRCDVVFVQNESQLEALLQAKNSKANVEKINGGDAVTFAGMDMKLLGYWADAEGNLVTEGTASGTIYAEGIVTLPKDEGFLLLRLNRRVNDGNIQDLKEELQQMEDNFGLTE